MIKLVDFHQRAKTTVTIAESALLDVATTVSEMIPAHQVATSKTAIGTLEIVTVCLEENVTL